MGDLETGDGWMGDGVLGFRFEVNYEVCSQSLHDIDWSQKIHD